MPTEYHFWRCNFCGEIFSTEDNTQEHEEMCEVKKSMISNYKYKTQQDNYE